jgi:hypothetical protein
MARSVAVSKRCAKARASAEGENQCRESFGAGRARGRESETELTAALVIADDIGRAGLTADVNALVRRTK